MRGCDFRPNEEATVMKTAVISSLCLLLGLSACGKTPDDPARYRKPELPGSSLSRPLLQSSPHEQADDAPQRGLQAAPRREAVTRWM
jgi:hypothetical protein